VPISCIISVRPSVSVYQRCFHWTHFREILAADFNENLSRKSRSGYNRTKILGILREDSSTFLCYRLQKFAKKHCFLLLVMTCNSAMHRECIVALPLQQELQELANMLRYTCIVYLVTAFVQLTNYDTKLQTVNTPPPADD
jgi:hypothetical protein